MNEEDIFRKIGFGLKFNELDYQKNSLRFQATPSKPFQISDLKLSNELDFFKAKPKPSLTIESDNSIPEKIQSNRTQQHQLENLSTETKKRSYKAKSNENEETPDHAGNPVDPTKSDKQVSSKYLRKMHKIYVEGSDVPGLITTFKQLCTMYNFNKTCLKNITEKMGFTSLTPIQMQAIPALLHSREMLACAPTGSGKTLSFLIPVVHHLLRPSVDDLSGSKRKGFRALILSPTKELAEQTYHECKTLILPESSDNTMKSKKPLLRCKILDKKETKIFTRIGASHSSKIDLLITTLNRIVYLLEQEPPLISLESVEWLIVDESDKLFEKAENNKFSFRHQLGQIYSACTNPKIRRAMFSATFAYDVQQWCVMNLDNVLQVTVGGKNTAVETVEQELKYVGNEQGKLLALKEIILLGFTPPVLVFVQSKERAKELFAELLYEGKKVDAIHGDRAASQRENAVKCFRRGDTWILICTELLGRGIDFKGVNLVVNYDFPTSAISYIHRIGRTGRAGRRGKAVTFFTDEDRPLLRSIANVVRQAGCEVPEYMLELRKPQKRERKYLARTERKRRTIRTAPREVINKRRKFSSTKPTSKITSAETKHNKTKVSKTQKGGEKTVVKKKTGVGKTVSTKKKTGFREKMRPEDINIKKQSNKKTNPKKQVVSKRKVDGKKELPSKKKTKSNKKFKSKSE